MTWLAGELSGRLGPGGAAAIPTTALDPLDPLLLPEIVFEFLIIRGAFSHR
jgi:hypothetical protein